MKPIRIMIVDDHFIVRMGLASSIEIEPDLQVVAEAASGEEALVLYQQHRPDVVLMDLRLPGLTGIEATARLIKQFPEARIIMLSTYDSEEDVYQALQAGARSYLSKDVLRHDLLRMIREVHAGQDALPAAAAARLAERVRRPELSPREFEVLREMVRGSSNKEIGQTLGITEFTVKLHVRNVLGKLNVTDRTQASIAAVRRGIISLEKE